MNFNEPYLAPNAPSFYPGGEYTLMFEGSGTILLGGGVSGGQSDISVTGYSASPNITVTTAGRTTGTLTLVSTMARGVVGTVTFQVPTPTHNGLTLQITALPDSANYIRQIAIVQSAYLQTLHLPGAAVPGLPGGPVVPPAISQRFSHL